MSSTLAPLSLSPDVVRLPFSPSCIKKVKNLVSKENTRATLVSVGTDEVTSCVDATVTQAFDVKTQKDSSGEESDGGDTELDYDDDERASVLPDKEDEEAEYTAEGGMTSLATSDGDGTQPMQIPNPDEANDEETANTQEV